MSGKRLPQLQDLSQEQRRVVESWGQGMAVLAGAGSGKTTTLTIKCAELLKLKPEVKFAAVSFTERSASDLRLKLTQRLSALAPGADTGALLKQGPLAGHWVMTIHGLCSAIIREYPREAGFDGDEQMLSESESALLWRRATELLFADELPEAVVPDLERMLARESRDQLFELIGRVRSLHGFGALSSLLAAPDPDSQALGRLGQFVLERYDRMKRRRGALDFDDLERGADRALSHERVREAYRARFELVLVDEFQDTNPVQAGIISRFAREDLSNLCVIGDPKQSIYRFRDADVSVFDDFCARMPVNISLTANFRSRPAIIEYVNGVCSTIFAYPQPGMPYEALRAGREPAADAPPPVTRLDVRDPSELARFVAAEHARGVPLESMALLLRRIRGSNERWLKALTAAGIPVAVGGGGRFWDDPRVRECVGLLKWWDNPGNQISAATFLRAPWVGIEDARLDAWAAQDRTFVKPFFASPSPLARALAPLREKIVRPGEVLLALCVSDEVEAEIGTALLGLWHRVEELSSRGLDFHAVVGELAQSLKQSRRERDVPPPRNLGQLSVLTLHSSKGLEFPNVILVDLGKKGVTPPAPPIYWDRREGAFLGVRDSDGKRDKEDPRESPWYKRERAREVEESKRLFYVALTRAQERLILVCPEVEPPKKQEEDPEKRAQQAYSADDWRGWIENAGERLAERVDVPEAVPALARKTVAPAPRARAITPPRWVRSRHSVTEWNLFGRCPRAYEWTYIRPVIATEAIPAAGIRTGAPIVGAIQEELSHRELGTRVHRCLELGDYDGLRALEKEAGVERFRAEPLVSWAMSSRWMAPSAPGRDVRAELEFEVPVGSGQILVGSIDRLVIDGGVASIIDFKVTSKAKSTEALIETYGTQMELYAHAARALLPGESPEVRATLVNISPEIIQSVDVPLRNPNWDDWVPRIDTILQGAPAIPRVGSLCRHCEFRAQCPEGSSS